ncbi:hypothetical protein SIID45300_02957 [Candidatus Magnetaquicoccaceae bacterium FCR-1]|uniref:Uncharacterized protein n=1 Tax=Candidatus Magnetaquiglobus chichijimensis TaxID=3141448 RepID=A0ABQ0CCI7_9PROT
MMISSSTIAMVALSATSGLGASSQGNPFDGFGPDYQLEISDQGLSLNTTTSEVTETKMRNVLTRILLETLFGADANTVSGSDDETAKQELVREVVVDPMLEDVMGRIVTLNRVA